MPTSATGTAASTSTTAAKRIERALRMRNAAARKRPSMARRLSMASRLFPRCTDNDADRAVTTVSRTAAAAARDPHRLAETAPRAIASDTAPSATRPNARKARRPHGCSEFDTQGRKPSIATRVITAKELEPFPMTTALALGWDDAILP